MNFIQIQRSIPLFDELIEKFQLIYPNNPCVIAGGCVRDILLDKRPKDIDVYFLGIDWTRESREDFKGKLDAMQLYYEIATSNLPWHKYERYLLLSIIWQHCAEMKDIEVQFMGFPTDSIEKLIETFDWEICLFGYRNQEIITTEGAIQLINKIQTYAPGDIDYKPPTMKHLNVQFPISNLRRGFKFEARYPIKLEYESIVKLCSEVMREDIYKRIAKKEK